VDWGGSPLKPKPFGLGAVTRDGYPVALLLASWRPRYIRALEQAHQGQYSPLVNIIGRAIEAGLDMFLEACAAIPEVLQRPLREIAEACAWDADYLGWLLRQRRICWAEARRALVHLGSSCATLPAGGGESGHSRRSTTPASGT